MPFLLKFHPFDDVKDKYSKTDLVRYINFARFVGCVKYDNIRYSQNWTIEFLLDHYHMCKKYTKG